MISLEKEAGIREFRRDEWESVVEALREELKEYGAFLNLLTEQQQLIMCRKAQEVYDYNALIEEQIGRTTELRLSREGLVREFGREIGFEGDATVKRLMVYFPETAQHLLQALIDEIYKTVQNIERRSRQNQMLIKRAMEVTEKVLEILQPRLGVKTYNPKGKVSGGLGEFVYMKASA